MVVLGIHPFPCKALLTLHIFFLFDAASMSGAMFLGLEPFNQEASQKACSPVINRDRGGGVEKIHVDM
jgi:hypothetical protein